MSPRSITARTGVAPELRSLFTEGAPHFSIDEARAFNWADTVVADELDQHHVSTLLSELGGARGSDDLRLPAIRSGVSLHHALASFLETAADTPSAANEHEARLIAVIRGVLHEHDRIVTLSRNQPQERK